MRIRHLSYVHQEAIGQPLRRDMICLRCSDAFELGDGRKIGVLAAQEDVLVITGDLPRLAWHIGNRHLAAEIDGTRILLRRDRIIRSMLEQLGARVSDVTEPFTPAHGAYHAHEH